MMGLSPNDLQALRSNLKRAPVQPEQPQAHHWSQASDTTTTLTTEATAESTTASVEGRAPPEEIPHNGSDKENAAETQEVES